MCSTDSAIRIIHNAECCWSTAPTYFFYVESIAERSILSNLILSVQVLNIKYVKVMSFNKVSKLSVAESIEGTSCP